jgi:uncharacterized protein (TIGR02145 family)
MNIFNRYGRTLLLAATVIAGVVCMSNCAERPAALVGHWVHFEGVTRNKPEELELFSDGTGVVDKEWSVTWKIENKRFVLLSQTKALSCDYKVSGYELTLVYDGADSTVFAKKDKLEEYRKKKFGKLWTYFTDSRDGQKYGAVKIGGKTWMAENLNHKMGNSWCYENDESNCDKYGRLYDWNTAKTTCPKGWHLPSRQEWNNLLQAVGGEKQSIKVPNEEDVILWHGAGKMLKAASGWNDNGNGTDEYGFSALPGGEHYSDVPTAGGFGFWWVAAEHESGKAYFLIMDSSYGSVGELYDDVSQGFSVRCVSNN